MGKKKHSIYSNRKKSTNKSSSSEKKVSSKPHSSIKGEKISDQPVSHKELNKLSNKSQVKSTDHNHPKEMVNSFLKKEKPHQNIIEKEVKVDLLFFPKKQPVHHEHVISPLKLFNFFRDFQHKPIDIERMSLEEMRRANRLLREILYYIKPNKNKY